MVFNTFDFLLFCLVVFPLQRILPHNPRNWFLLAASYFFYGYWDWRFLGLIGASTLLDWWLGLTIGREGDPAKRKRWVVFSVAANLSFIGFFKYFNFFIGTAQDTMVLLGFNPERLHLNIILPVGISFYTFQSLSYTLDVYRRAIQPVPSLRDYALFVAFFPQLVAGPIVRARDFIGQLASKPRATWEQVRVGSWLITWGLFKKAVIADNLAVIVDQAFGRYQTLTGPEVIMAVYAFAFQIYGDFSGYSDMARGLAKLMGYEFNLNFRLPYFATNPADFWHRWHISLSSWLRDYLYIPLGGNRLGPARSYLNLFLTMLLGGLWHGAAWTFVIWGLYHGLLLAAHRYAARSQCLPSPPGHWEIPWWGVRVFVMFHLTCFGWLLFRAENMDQIITMTSAVFNHWAWTSPASRWAWQILVVCLPLMIVQIVQAVTADLNVVIKMSMPVRAICYSVVVGMLLSLGSFGGKAFIYFQF